MMKQVLNALLVVSISGILSCSNVLKEMANKTTDEALQYQARKLLNSRDFTGAIESLQKMTSEGLATTDSQVLLASAYAGRCGLDAIQLAQNLSGSTGNFFSVLFAGFPKSTASKVADCRAARTILASLSSPNADHSVFLAFVAISTIGANLNRVFDANQDNVIDSPVAQCDSTASGVLKDADAVDVAVSLAYAIKGLADAGSSIAGSDVSIISSLCGPTGLVPNACSKLDPTAYTAAEIKVLRGAITSTDYFGLGNCGDKLIGANPATLTNCTCP